ncbi:MAG: hypothetical protein RQ763_00120 [Sulfurimonas sp.]|uniref:hypothetical protein n=1 Tax=Sulfurimonas sp. TaxID=2022749 RepID=UPI0028CEF60D|nr:hypothetical protein [Sulfurimonas sp.]MDT8337578.1 hypothetical protein [Sulfurimonas sp.]
MAIDTEDLSTIYDTFLSKSLKELNDTQASMQMEDEHFSAIMSEIIKSSMENSVRAYQAINANALVQAQIATELKKALDIVSTTTVRDLQNAKDLLLKDEQISMLTAQQATELKKALDIVSTTTVRDLQNAKDLLLKDEQISMLTAQQATELKKALDIVSTTAVRNANSAADIINKTKQGVLLDKQALKLIVDTLFVEKQTLELGRSVEFNNNIKALDSYADMVGTMGAGGLVISSDMWTTLFAMINALNTNATVPTSTTITKL